MAQSQNEIKFLHFRDTIWGDTNPRGGVTIAFRPFNEDALGNMVLFSAARCSADDNFNKATGRKLATARLNNGEVGLAVVRNEKQFAEMLEDALYERFGYTRKFSRKRRR